jgi:hypothetical protein
MERKHHEPTIDEIFVECCNLKNHGKSPDYADAYAKLYIEQNLIDRLSDVFDNFNRSNHTITANYKDMIKTRVMERINIHLKNLC